MTIQEPGLPRSPTCSFSVCTHPILTHTGNHRIAPASKLGTCKRTATRSLWQCDTRGRHERSKTVPFAVLLHCETAKVVLQAASSWKGIAEKWRAEHKQSKMCLCRQHDKHIKAWESCRLISCMERREGKQYKQICEKNKTVLGKVPELDRFLFWGKIQPQNSHPSLTVCQYFDFGLEREAYIPAIPLLPRRKMPSVHI